MNVTEIFHSLQGEGTLAGVPSVFIRLAGCPLRCRWCDTAHARDYEAGTAYDPDALVAEVMRWSCRHVVITGGEPMAAPDLAPRSGLVELTQRLRERGRHITIETAGVVFIEDVACDLMSISPKLSNALGSGSEAEDRPSTDLQVLRRLMSSHEYQLKFVVDSPADLDEIEWAVAELGGVSRGNVLLMPQSRTRAEYLQKAPRVAKLCLDSGFRFCPRLQTLLWDNARGR